MFDVSNAKLFCGVNKLHCVYWLEAHRFFFDTQWNPISTQSSQYSHNTKSYLIKLKNRNYFTALKSKRNVESYVKAHYPYLLVTYWGKNKVSTGYKKFSMLPQGKTLEHRTDQPLNRPLIRFLVIDQTLQFTAN